MEFFNIPTENNLADLKKQVLLWAAQFDKLAYYDNNEYTNNAYHRYEMILGCGAWEEIEVLETESGFKDLEIFLETQVGQWILGYLSYDLKNELEQLQSNHQDHLGFAKLHFFVPKHLILIYPESERVEIFSHTLPPKEIWAAIQKMPPIRGATSAIKPNIQARITKKEYLSTIDALRGHIIEGDIYELNFCQEFYVEQISIDPLPLFVELNERSPAPFAAYYRNTEQHLLCASPERFLYKEGNKLISQPIKGTIRRGVNEEEDRLLGQALLNSEKDRAENVMIVDLVRNDLAKTCEPGTVEVEELFGIYAFQQVLQMISTVSGQLKETENGLSALKSAFPMGSMTGAPKVMTMELIEHYEKTQRGLYSGAVGYFTPDGDFDFNVVIRSILYNASRNYLSFQVGGAIVYDSQPEGEYEECLLKAKGMFAALNSLKIKSQKSKD